MGLPGSGKTHLAEHLSVRLKGVHLNADQVRATLNRDLGFSSEDRIEHARRMGCMAQFIKDSGHFAIADFVCPLPETRAAFCPDFVIFMDTIKEGRFEDTNKLFVPPARVNVKISTWDYEVEDLAVRLESAARRQSEASSQ